MRVHIPFTSDHDRLFTSDVPKPQDPASRRAPRAVRWLDPCKGLLIKTLAMTTLNFNHERVMMEVDGEKAQAVESSSGNGNSAVGSKPPSCVSKCKSCTPCTPVRVPVQPGTPNTSEYYPEAWRCKCGGKLYMP